MAKKVLFSGVKPTGDLHIGNYFGAIRQFVELQHTVETPYYAVVDYHALNSVQDKAMMAKGIIEIARAYLALGLDPKKAIIFKQSDVPEHTELTWIFDTITTMPFLQRAHAYKDAVAKDKEIVVGTFNYPMLMAADILLYDTNIVPVGQDQKQHVEIARDTALKFNHIYGDAFTLPDAHIVEDVAVVPGVDGRKMSKSYGNVIPLFGSDEEIEKAVMSIVTDSKKPEDPKDAEADNVFKIHKLVTPEPILGDLKKRYEEGGMSYKESKEMLIKSLHSFIKPIRDRHAAISDDDVKKVLKHGGLQAREAASEKMKKVRELIGVSLY
jgi:tryptophanyl-tRNA synthetase